MKVGLSIDLSVEGTSPEVEDHIEEVVAEEARRFIALLTDRLEAEGITDVQIVGFDESGED